MMQGYGMTSANSHGSEKVAQLVADGMREQGIPSRVKLEEICDMSYGYLQHLIEGHIRHPKAEILERLAHTLSQPVEAYQAALLADRHELPAPALYFSMQLGTPVDARAAELAMEVVKELISRTQQVKK
jgi:hypothetical protein